eukprot:14964269-Alexandrium_andersonii.AAC.1
MRAPWVFLQAHYRACASSSSTRVAKPGSHRERLNPNSDLARAPKRDQTDQRSVVAHPAGLANAGTGHVASW